MLQIKYVSASIVIDDLSTRSSDSPGHRCRHTTVDTRRFDHRILVGKYNAEFAE